jgi:hypothetical protein
MALITLTIDDVEAKAKKKERLLWVALDKLLFAPSVLWYPNQAFPLKKPKI